MRKILYLIFIALIFQGKMLSQCNASFIFNYGPGGQVTFSSTSTGTLVSTSYTWTFGNATSSVGVNLINTSCTYTTNGTYTVILAINGGTACNSSTTAVVTITNAPSCSIFANYSYSEGTNGLVNFTNTSTGTIVATTYTWNYGDGSFSTGIAPPHTYSANGMYTGWLYASNNATPACVDSATISVNVTSYCQLLAGFTWTAASLSASFQSTSSGTIGGSSYSWNFGDGNNSFLMNPSHTYSASGVYNVTLSVNNGTVVPACTNSTVLSVTVTQCLLNASFAHTVEAGGNVQFMNTSVGTTDVSLTYWDFGDGNSGAGATASNIYSSAGAYVVKMIADNGSGCSDTSWQSVNVTGITCNANAGFQIVPTGTPQYWYAIPNYPWNVASAQWAWGDLSSSNTLYASHNYATAGNYSVCLTVTVSCGNTATWCYTKLLNKNSESSQMVHINVMPPGTPEGLRENFISDKPFVVFPNPSDGRFDVFLSDPSNPTLFIYDVNGRVVFEKENLKVGQNKMEAAQLAEGIYIVTLKDEQSEYRARLVIRK